MSALFSVIKNKNKFHELKFRNSFIARLNGSCCQTSEDLYNELQVAFEFPDYFGRNLDALYDCLMDLEWITQDRIILVIEHFDDLLKDESNDPELLEDFLITLEDVCRSWEVLENDDFTPKSVKVYLSDSNRVMQLLDDNDIEYGII